MGVKKRADKQNGTCRYFKAAMAMTMTDGRMEHAFSLLFRAVLQRHAKGGFRRGADVCFVSVLDSSRSSAQQSNDGEG
jgi:hypothetical protein